MAGKKAPGKFTIGLNENDPAHRQVMELLNQQGRRKAQFIVNAVLHYIHCPETPEIPQPAPVDSQTIEEIVLKILRQQETGGQAPVPAKQAVKKASTSESIHVDGVEELLGKDGLSRIASTLAAFRND